MSPKRAYSRIPAQLTKISILTATFDHGFNDGSHIIGFGHIASDDKCCPSGGRDRRGYGGGVFLVTVVVDRNRSAGATKPRCDRRAYATRRSGDDCDFALKF